MKATDIKYIVIHCSAGFAGREGIERFWKETLGWKSPGYHRLIETDGKVHCLSDFHLPTNGVKGFNSQSIHICYVGGVERQNGKLIAKDTRTPEQKSKIELCIFEAITWLRDNGKDITEDLTVLGHRDFSPDKNGNGVIESWERIKECPSFDAMPEYRDYSSVCDPSLPNSKNKL
jgi:N-acetylmuramoyl-L-alanine amidase